MRFGQILSMKRPKDTPTTADSRGIIELSGAELEALNLPSFGQGKSLQKRFKELEQAWGPLA